jgi:hypothetical protein
MDLQAVLATMGGPLKGPEPAERITANMNLYAVLPALGELVKLDAEAGRIAAEMAVTLEFHVLRGPRVLLRFDHGKVTAEREGCSDLGLLFLSCDRLNRMFAGEKITPIPFGSLWRFAELQRFEKLSAILTRYLKPSVADMKVPAFRKAHVGLSLLVGLSATREVADLDRKARRVAAHLYNGSIQYSVGDDGPDAYVEIKDGVIQVRMGKLADPTTTIGIRDVDLAVDLIANRVDTFAANGAGDIRASGDLHLADEFNHLFERVGLYLK